VASTAGLCQLQCGAPTGTRAVKLLTYAEGVDAFRLAHLSDSDRANLMGGTLSRIYDWSPAKA
jgi:L-fuconolactonase